MLAKLETTEEKTKIDSRSLEQRIEAEADRLRKLHKQIRLENDTYVKDHNVHIKESNAIVRKKLHLLRCRVQVLIS